MGLVAGLTGVCAVSVLATLLLVPAWIFPRVAGAVCGMGWGLVAATIAAVVSALAAFLLARYVLRALVERAARRNQLFKSVDGAVKKDGWKVVALLRMSPVLPSGFKSYFLGLTRVRLADYLTASAAGMLPGILLKVYVGAAGRGAMTEGGALNWTLFAAGVAATIALTMIVGRKVRARLKL
jgi:uncharacterized membrane protein YdjX (TVP38/TMEM64 family)